MPELDPKAAAFARFRLHADTAAHAFGSPLGDGQAHAGAGIGLDGMEPLEQAEELAQVTVLDADAVVFDPEADKALVLLRPQADSGLSP